MFGGADKGLESLIPQAPGAMSVGAIDPYTGQLLGQSGSTADSWTGGA